MANTPRNLCMKLLNYWSWPEFLLVSIEFCRLSVKKICKFCFNNLEDIPFLFINTRRQHKEFPGGHALSAAVFLWSPPLCILHTICGADSPYLLFQGPPSPLLLLRRSWGLNTNRTTALSNWPSLRNTDSPRSTKRRKLCVQMLRSWTSEILGLFGPPTADSVIDGNFACKSNAPKILYSTGIYSRSWSSARVL